MKVEPTINTKKFIESVNSLIEKGVVGSLAEVGDAIDYDRTSITNVMKGRRNVPISVYRRFAEVYKLNKPVSGLTVNEPIEPYNDFRERYINSLESQVTLLKDQVNLATGELRHIAVMNFAMLKTMRTSVARLLAKSEKEDLMTIAGRLDKETASFYKSVREKGSLVDLGI